jgi:hypothetical protein
MLASCGSGNLGKIVEAQHASAPPPPPPAPMDTPDAAPSVEPVDAGSRCGDGQLQLARGEQCDGADLGGRSCMDLGLGAGQLGCNPATCQLVVTQCAQTGIGPALPPSVNKTPPKIALDSGVIAADAGQPAQTCPTGFTCQPSTFQSGKYICEQWTEDAPPLCLRPATDTGCADILPGSACTDTGVGAFCMLPCRP